MPSQNVSRETFLSDLPAKSDKGSREDRPQKLALILEQKEAQDEGLESSDA
jgi:hypothetical protein